MIRFISFFVIVVLAATGPVPLIAIAAFFYAVRYTAYELVLVAVCIDAYYGAGQFPYFLLVTVFAIVVIELCKPYIRVRERTV